MRHPPLVDGCGVLIRSNEVAPLAGVPFHANTPRVLRRAPRDFPLHVAIHRVQDAARQPETYVWPHSHQAPELNLLLGEPGELEYSYSFAGRARRIASPALVWIPAGVAHSAQVCRGSGVFVCAILASSARAFSDGPPAESATLAGREHVFQAGEVVVQAAAGAGFPLELAIDRVGEAQSIGGEPPSCLPVAALHLLLAEPGCLEARYQLDGRDCSVQAPASIWLPAGLPHALQAARGSGVLVRLVLRPPVRGDG